MSIHRHTMSGGSGRSIWFVSKPGKVDMTELDKLGIIKPAELDSREPREQGNLEELELPPTPWKASNKGETFELPLHPTPSLQHLARYGNSWEVSSVNRF